MKRYHFSSLVAPLLVLACSSPSDDGTVYSQPAGGTTSVDADGNGIADDLSGTTIDLNGDGMPDTQDVTGDGISDGVLIDTNGDGMADALGLDTNGDGIVDAFDFNFDGLPDQGSTIDPSPAPGDGDGNPGTINTGTWNAFVMNGAEASLAAEYETWKDAYLKIDCGTGVYSVLKSSNEVVSEGIGYGMLITATLGSQEEFDGILAYYKASSKTDSGLMSWACDACNPSSCGGASAPDGDVDAAMAILQADQRWGGYATDALDVIQKIRGPEIVETCGGLTVLKPGEWGGCSDDGSKFINPSYFSPGYFRAFAKVDTAGAATWEALIEASYKVFEDSKDNHHHANLLWPDGLEWNAGTMTFGGSTGFAGNGYDACRVPWRIAIDYAWSGDPRAKALLEYTAGAIDASPSGMAGMSTDQNSAFWGGLAVSGVGVSQEKADAYYNAWMAADLDDVPYFQGTLRLIYLLVAAGKFPSTL